MAFPDVTLPLRRVVRLLQNLLRCRSRFGGHLSRQRSCFRHSCNNKVMCFVRRFTQDIAELRHRAREDRRLYMSQRSSHRCRDIVCFRRMEGRFRSLTTQFRLARRTRGRRRPRCGRCSRRVSSCSNSSCRRRTLSVCRRHAMRQCHSLGSRYRRCNSLRCRRMVRRIAKRCRNVRQRRCRRIRHDARRCRSQQCRKRARFALAKCRGWNMKRCRVLRRHLVACRNQRCRHRVQMQLGRCFGSLKRRWARLKNQLLKCRSRRCRNRHRLWIRKIRRRLQRQCRRLHEQMAHECTTSACRTRVQRSLRLCAGWKPLHKVHCTQLKIRLRKCQSSECRIHIRQVIRRCKRCGSWRQRIGQCATKECTNTLRLRIQRTCARRPRQNIRDPIIPAGACASLRLRLKNCESSRCYQRTQAELTHCMMEQTANGMTVNTAPARYALTHPDSTRAPALPVYGDDLDGYGDASGKGWGFTLQHSFQPDGNTIPPGGKATPPVDNLDGSNRASNTDHTYSDRNTMIIVVASLTGFVLLLLIILIVLCCLMRRRGKKKSKISSSSGYAAASEFQDDFGGRSAVETRK